MVYDQIVARLNGTCKLVIRLDKVSVAAAGAELNVTELVFVCPH